MNYATHDFIADVIERSYKIPVLVDFWAEWCAPCRVLGPILEHLAETHRDQLAFVKLNTEDHPDIAAKYGVQGIPTVKLFVDGEIAAEFIGALPEEVIEQWLQKALPSKYQKQIKQAQQLLSEGNVRKAQKVLQDVLKAEPENQQATVLLARTYIYSDYQKALELVKNISEGSDYGDIAEAIRTFGTLLQLREQPETLPESAVKKQYLAAIEHLHSEHFEKALEEFIAVIRRDRDYHDDGARKACIAIFTFLGENHEITKKYRRDLSSALYV
jgi:putative thioredoxin